MDGFGDNFDQADVDPAAEFLAREKDQLAGLGDDVLPPANSADSAAPSAVSQGNNAIMLQQQLLQRGECALFLFWVDQKYHNCMELLEWFFFSKKLNYTQKVINRRKTKAKIISFSCVKQAIDILKKKCVRFSGKKRMFFFGVCWINISIRWVQMGVKKSQFLTATTTIITKKNNRTCNCSGCSHPSNQWW